MTGEPIYQTGHGRVFFQPLGAGPAHPMAYLGRARLSGATQSFGEPTPVRNPSSKSYDQFEDIDEIQGDESRPTTSMIARFGLTNEILEANCPFHVQAHYGKCANPQDQNGGWEIIMDYDKARFTSKGVDEQTALEPGDRAAIMVTGEISARRWTIGKHVTLGEVAGTEVTVEVIAVLVDDYLSCGECGYESDGNKRIFAICKSTGLASPNLNPLFLASYDGGLTWESHDINSMGNAEDPTDLAVFGNNVVVSVNTAASVHTASLDDLDNWTESPAVYADGVNALFALSATQVWAVGDAGYVWYSDNVSAEVTVQDAGVVTVEDLNDIDGVDSQNLVAVGDNGAIIVTTNGGKTWFDSPTVPAAAVDILCVWMRTAYCWIIGESGGRMYYTGNAGQDWTEIVYPTSGQGAVHSIVFAGYKDSPWGYMTAEVTAGMSYIFRSIDGGASWYTLPDNPAPTPANVRLNSLSAGYSPNFVVAGGLKDIGGDGIIIIGQ